MINLTQMERKTLDKLVTQEGFFCEKCGGWNGVFYTTVSLKTAMKKLEGMSVTRKDFRYHFGKVLRKAEGVREKAISG